jgi:riboflavin biosynthesis pyrimidine reductase
MPAPAARPWVYSNFVSTLDGVVSLHSKSHLGGADISGSSAEDRMVMGLLRAIADIVIVGAGTLGADPEHVWTADAIFPTLEDDYRHLSAALGQRTPPLNVVVTGGGAIDLRLPVFSSGRVPALVLTSTAGARRLRRQRKSESVEIRALRSRGGIFSANAILEAVCRVRAGKRILVEGGPRLLADFYAERLLDEQFLTLAPQIAGRETGDGRPGLVMGKHFAPRQPLWGRLIDARRADDQLFLRYAFAPASGGARSRGRRRSRP